MPYVIAEPCTNDGACVEVCPVGCIHTTPGAPQHYIDPEICIECEQCEVVCPVDAIFLHHDLPEEWHRYIDINAKFFRQNKAIVGPVPLETAWQMVELAQAYATQVGASVTVAVTDGAGAPIAIRRMEGAALTSVDLALYKAHTAMNFHVSTSDLVTDSQQPWFRSLVISSRGRILPAAGAIPIVDEAAIIGAISVAGGSSEEQDLLCARAGLAALSGVGH